MKPKGILPRNARRWPIQAVLWKGGDAAARNCIVRDGWPHAVWVRGTHSPKTFKEEETESSELRADASGRAHPHCVGEAACPKSHLYPGGNLPPSRNRYLCKSPQQPSAFPAHSKHQEQKLYPLAPVEF